MVHTAQEQPSVIGAQSAPNMSNARYRVWWVPQMPMRPFHHEVPDYTTGELLCDVLGRYDLFQYRNRIKPDYANMGGVEWLHPSHTEGEWWTLERDEAEELGLVPVRSASDDHQD